MNTPPPEVKG